MIDEKQTLIEGLSQQCVDKDTQLALLNQRNEQLVRLVEEAKQLPDDLIKKVVLIAA